MKCDLKPTLSCTYINLRRERGGGGEGEERMRGNNQRGEGGENRRGSKIKISYTSYEEKKKQRTKQQMGHRYKENGKIASRREKEGRNKKKRLVMSMSSVTSFVDSPRVSMTTS